MDVWWFSHFRWCLERRHVKQIIAVGRSRYFPGTFSNPQGKYLQEKETCLLLGTFVNSFPNSKCMKNAFLIQNRRKTRESSYGIAYECSLYSGDLSKIVGRHRTKTSYVLAYEGSLYSGDLYWGDKLAFSVVPLSVCLSVCRAFWSLA